jgi:hypothetical protein
MGLAISVIFLALGANLVWGIEYSIAGFSLEPIGWICIVVGAVGVALAAIGELRSRAGATARDRTVKRQTR